MPNKAWYDSALSPQDKKFIADFLVGYEDTDEYNTAEEGVLELASDYVVSLLAEKNERWKHMPEELRGPFTKRWVELQKHVSKILKLEDPAP